MLKNTLTFAAFLIVFISISSPTFAKPDVEDCRTSDAIHLKKCIKMTNQLKKFESVGNMTKEQIEKSTKNCKEALDCLAEKQCLQAKAAHHYTSLMCDAIKFQNIDFPPCQEKLNVVKTCFNELQAAKTLNANPCDATRERWQCGKTVIPKICGNDSWKLFDKFTRIELSLIDTKCKIEI